MSKSKSFKSFKEKTGLLKHILACTVLKGLLALSANFWKNHFFWITPKFTESSLKYFEYPKYCVVEMVDEMRVVIYGKDKLQKKLVFDLSETFVCHGCSFNYKMYLFAHFYFGDRYPNKADIILIWKFFFDFIV